MAVILAVAIAVTAFTACAPVPSQGLKDPFFAEDAPSLVGDNLDEAEAKWRREIEHERASDPDALLTDDPPGKPDQYGNVASQDEERPKTFWGKVKSGADTVGKASFAAATVLVTIGMIVAPYLLL
jgi:hypothetical protein